MKCAQFPWFVNGLNNTTESGIFTLPACTIKGYQLSIAAGALDWTYFFEQPTYAVFDFAVMISDNGNGYPGNLNQIATYIGNKQIIGTNAPPAFEPQPGGKIIDGLLTAAYVIVEEPAEHANTQIVVPYGGITVPVPANSFLYLQVGHSGGKGTFATKLALYYDEVTNG